MNDAQKTIECIYRGAMNKRDSSHVRVPDEVEAAFTKEYMTQYNSRQRIAEFKAATRIYVAFLKGGESK